MSNFTIRLVGSLFGIVIAYSLISYCYFHSNYGIHLSLTRDIAGPYEYFVFPYYYTAESFKGIMDKRKFNKIVQAGLEDEISCLTLSPYEFSVFYDNYRSSVVDPDTFGDDGRNVHVANNGAELGRTQFCRFINRHLKNIGSRISVNGIGHIIEVNVDEKLDMQIERIISDYRERVIKICHVTPSG